MNTKSSIFIITVFALIILAMNLSITIPDINQNQQNDHIGEISYSMSVGQTFISNYDKLYRIDINMATYNRTNTKDIIFHLKTDPKSENDLRRISVNASQIDDNAYHTFEFKPIKNSKNEKYYFSIESPESVDGNAITLYYSTNDIYKNGSIYLYNIESNGDIKFRTFHHSSIFTPLYESYKKILSDKLFLILYLITIALLIILSVNVVRLLWDESD